APARTRPVVLDDELDHTRLVASLDADFGCGHAVETPIERAAHGLRHDQPDRDGDIRADRHDGSADMVSRLRQVRPPTGHRDLSYQIADELLEVDQRPA